MYWLHMNKPKDLIPGFQETEPGLTLEVLPRKTDWETLWLEISSMLRMCEIFDFLKYKYTPKSIVLNEKHK